MRIPERMLSRVKTCVMSCLMTYAMSLLMTICLVLGSTYLIQASLINAKAMLGQWLIQNAWEKTLLTRERQLPWPWADTYPVAKLSVPHLAKEFFVLQGATGESMSFGPGMTTYLDENDQLAVILIQAHRDTHFSFLPRLEVGDVIELEHAENWGLQRYVVQQRQRVKRPEIQLNDTLENPVLILSTCAQPINSNKNVRDVLFARTPS